MTESTTEYSLIGIDNWKYIETTLLKFWVPELEIHDDWEGMRNFWRFCFVLMEKYFQSAFGDSDG